MPTKTLTLRGLNRATLARQMLLGREKTTALRAIQRLVGLQAQEARPPFVGLWSRLEKFRREDLLKLLHNRKVVRTTAMRATLHLHSAKDYLQLRPTLQPALSQALQSALRKHLDGLDIAGLAAEARSFFEEEHRTFAALRVHLARLHPEVEPRVMGYAVRMHLPLVQVPTEAVWGYPSTADFAPAESWLGSRLAADGHPRALVLRYLAAFGPATAGDAQTWSGLRGLGEVFEALRPRLGVFRDERGRELLDLPKAPRPPGDTPAPVRFLPDYDNLVLSHADRTRIIADRHRGALVTKNLRVRATFLVDGFVAGTWKVERGKASAKLVIEPFEGVSKSVREELTDEGNRLVRFLEADAAAFAVRFGGGR